jgi:mRNA interferase RelE/StbE
MLGDGEMDVDYTNQAKAYLDKQTEKQSTRIKRSVYALPAGDVKKLRGIENGYRLRVGNVRILFEKDGNNIHIFKIDNRGDVYKK